MWKLSIALLIASLPGILSTTGFALTIDQKITPAYVREHPEEFAISVRMNQDGLVVFTIVRTLSDPKYLVARLSVRHNGKSIAESHTPCFAKKNDNRFHFSISPVYLAETQFELGESAVREGVPLPGTTRFQFQVKDFVPEDLWKTVSEG